MTRQTIRKVVLTSALTILAGCAKETQPDDGDTYPVAFAAEDVFGTRADAGLMVDGTTTRTIPPGKSIGVYAWEGAAATGRAGFMRNQEVTNEGGSAEGNLTYSPMKYWPNDGTGITFQAYYPHEGGQDGTGITLTQTDGPASLVLAVKDNPSEQIDLLVSDILTDVKRQPADGKVTLPFRHCLAKVSIAADIPAGSTLESITLTGVRNRGTLTQSVAGGVTTDTWSGLHGTGTYRCDTPGTAGTLLMIPQSLGTEAKATLAYSTPDSNGDPVMTTFTADLSKSGVSEWRAGEAYRYTLAISSGHLRLTVTPAPWDYHPKTMDYSTEVTVRREGRISWQTGTYAEKDDTERSILLGFRQTAVCSFMIDTPEGAIWKAVLKTVEGATGVFEFVDSEGSGFRSMSGNVGEPATLRIRAKDNYPAQLNAAILSIYVESGGKNILVTSLVSESGDEWTIKQDKND